jgi:hypothetical protein
MSWGAIAAAAAGTAQGLYSGWKNVNEQRKILDFQKDQAKNQMQWKVADYEKAGLNKILAAGQGTSGQVANLQAPHHDYGDASKKAVEALTMMKAKNDIATSESQKRLIDQQNAKTYEERKIIANDGKLLRGEKGGKGILSTSPGSNKTVANIIATMKGLLPGEKNAVRDYSDNQMRKHGYKRTKHGMIHKKYLDKDGNIKAKYNKYNKGWK